MYNSKLTNGNIPSATRCPFAEVCGGYKGDWCTHKGYANLEVHHCTLALAYDLCESIKHQKIEKANQEFEKDNHE